MDVFGLIIWIYSYLEGGETMNTRVLVMGVIVLALLGGGYFLLSNRASQPAPVENTAQTTPPDQSETTPSDAAMQNEGKLKEFTVESNGLNFSLNEMKVKVGDTVKITYKNNKGKHDFVIDEYEVKTKLLNEGESETVEFRAEKAGTFEFYCDVSGHRAAGMKGSLIVE